METVIIVVHLMVVAALIGLVLVQRSEGGALGVGGGGNFMATRSRANVLTRTTGYLAAGFFATSILLTVLAKINAPPSIMDTIPVGDAATGTTTENGRPTTGGILDLLPPRAGSTTVIDTPTQIPTDAGNGVPAAPLDAAPATPTVPTDAVPAVPTDAAPAVPTDAAPAADPAAAPVVPTP